MNPETRIQNEILIALSREGVLARRNMVGTFRRLRSDAVIKVGTEGEADITAIVPILIRQEHVGLILPLNAEIEVKTATGIQEESQIDFEAACNRIGAIYRIARSTEEALRIIRKLRE